MKTILMMLAMMASITSFVACGGKSNTTTEESATTSQGTEATGESATTQTGTTSPVSTGDELLAKYEKLVDKVIELFPKVMTGDVSAAKEYSEVMTEIDKIMAESAELLNDLSQEQQLRLVELSRKVDEETKKTVK
jgi:ABC-type glycerol-3-phosphate transport system substrate-binding protein